MNILLINHYAGSPTHGMEFRPHGLAREWVRLGHRVEIVAASHSHVRSRQPDMQGLAERHETIDGITYRWLRAPAYRGNGWRRAINIAAFLARLAWRSGRLARDFRPDLVIASSTYPLDTILARRLARQARCPWVYEVHDLWPLSLIELSGLSPRHPFVRLCDIAERSAYRSADRVVSMLPKVQAHMAARGLDLQRLSIVPNGVSLQDWDQEPPPLRPDVQAVLQEFQQAGQAIVGYAGSMGAPNALDTLLDAAALMRSEPIGFVLVGDGHERERLQHRIAGEALSKVRLLPPIPKAQMPRLLAALDVAYIGWRPMPLYRFGIAPNKLMDYMVAGCVVLHSVHAGNDPVADAGCGLTVPPGDAGAVAEGLRSLLRLDPQQRQAMGQAGRAHVRAHHAYPVLAQRFLEPFQTPPPTESPRPPGRGLARHAFLQPDVWQTLQERQRVFSRFLLERGCSDLSSLRVLEVGCGAGGNLLELLRMGFAPENLSGIEIDAARHAHARWVLPASVPLMHGDALQAWSHRFVEPASQDLVLQATVFSSILDESLQERLAQQMWAWVRPGGAVLWYDFTVDNPRNPKVRGQPLGRVRALFPQARLQVRRVTLAPPLARWVCALHPSLYHVLNACPWLRTHLLVWAQKPLDGTIAAPPPAVSGPCDIPR